VPEACTQVINAQTLYGQNVFIFNLEKRKIFFKELMRKGKPLILDFEQLMDMP
jgi:hypothetical protein